MNISIILAAGEGTRMKSKIPKVLHKVCGKSILEYVLSASKRAQVEKNIVIVGHQSEKIKEYFKNDDIIFLNQPIGENEPYGTAFATMQANDYIDDENTVIILYGDTPLITEDTIDKLVEYHKEKDNQLTVLTALLDEPKGYGRIKRDENFNIQEIVEEKDTTQEEKQIKEINSGIYCFSGKSLKYALSKIENNNAQGEYYLTDAVSILKNQNYRVGAYIIENSTEIHGVNSRVQLAFCEEQTRKKINLKHMENGVTIIDSKSTYIESNVKIGIDTIIYPNVILEGNTKIGEDCIIRSNTRICDSIINNKVSIESSTIENSTVDDESKIGPNAHLRPKSHVGKNVKVGNFVEIKNASIDNNSKAGHLAYIGDASVGKNVNIGCGAIFVNYDGKSKHKTIVGDNSFIGSNSNLIAPLNVKEKGYVAAGSTITKEVQQGDLAIERAKQVNISGWVDRKKTK